MYQWEGSVEPGSDPKSSEQLLNMDRVTSKIVDNLEAVQEKYVRLILEVPVSTPKASLRAETGLLSMKHRIWYEKVNFLLSLRRKKEGLAKQVYEEQVLNGWSGQICQCISVPSANQNMITKKELSLALRNHDRDEIAEKFTTYKKLDKIVNDDPTVVKNYMMEKSMADARLTFRLRTEMVDVKDNMRSKYKGAKVNCEACNLEVAESQVHVMVCPGYVELRIGKDMQKDKDLVSYFREVLLTREKKKSTR